MNQNIEYAIATSLLIILSAELFISQFYVSITWDEPLHIASGYAKLITGDYRMNTEHPPLIAIIESAPLLLLKPTLTLDDSWTNKNMIEFTKKFFFEDNKNPKQMLFYSRMPMILITILLGIIMYFWTKKMFGTTAALITLALYTFEPNILAHGILTTTDMGFTFFAILALCGYWKFFNSPTNKNLFLASITMGLAQLTKYTAIFLWPAYLIITLAHRKKIYFHTKSLCIIALTSILIINAAYLFQGTGTPIAESMRKDTTLNKELYSPEKTFSQDSISWFIADKIPSVLPYHYIKGLGFVINEGKSPNQNLVMGKSYENGALHYFVSAFAVKTTIAILLLLTLAIFLPQKNIRGTINWPFILIPAITILTALSIATKQTGIRYALIIIPLLIIWISGRICNTKAFANKYFKTILYIIVAGHAISSLAAFPNYIAYYNEFIGIENGWKYFTDSNTDWGQDFDKLVSYVKCKPETKIQYSGTTDLAFYGIEKNKAKEKCDTGTLAISAQTTANKNFEWLKKYEPFEKIGKSILLYNITKCE